MTTESDDEPAVLFVCVHNAGRSVERLTGELTQ